MLLSASRRVSRNWNATLRRALPSRVTAWRTSGQAWNGGWRR